MEHVTELFIKRGIVRCWKAATSGATGIHAVFSPYITSRTAETVLLGSRAGEMRDCQV